MDFRGNHRVFQHENLQQLHQDIRSHFGQRHVSSGRFYIPDIHLQEENVQQPQKQIEDRGETGLLLYVCDAIQSHQRTLSYE